MTSHYFMRRLGTWESMGCKFYDFWSLVRWPSDGASSRADLIFVLSFSPLIFSARWS
jgi:hypothetical protein